MERGVMEKTLLSKYTELYEIRFVAAQSGSVHWILVALPEVPVFLAMYLYVSENMVTLVNALTNYDQYMCYSVH